MEKYSANRKIEKNKNFKFFEIALHLADYFSPFDTLTKLNV